MQKNTTKYVIDVLKKKDLVSFIESIASVNFGKIGDKSVCICPMPFHKDSKPSFGVTETASGAWLYNCFGCGSGGSILDFVMDYFSIESVNEAISMLMKHFKINSDVELITESIKEAKVSVNAKKEMECEHIQASSACRCLLRKYHDDKEVHAWVAKKYKLMNNMLKKADTHGISQIKNEALKKLVS